MPMNMFPDQYSTILKKSQCTLCRNKDCVFIQPISGALNLFPACNPHWVYLASAWDSCMRQSKLWSGGATGPTKALKPVSESSERYLPVNEAAMQKIFPTEEKY